jgi:hypothetical protein
MSKVIKNVVNEKICLSKKRNLFFARIYAVKHITREEILKNATQKLASLVRTSESTKNRDTIEVNAVNTPKIITDERMSEKFVAIKVGW